MMRVDPLERDLRPQELRRRVLKRLVERLDELNLGRKPFEETGQERGHVLDVRHAHAVAAHRLVVQPD